MASRSCRPADDSLILAGGQRLGLVPVCTLSRHREGDRGEEPVLSTTRIGAGSLAFCATCENAERMWAAGSHRSSGHMWPASLSPLVIQNAGISYCGAVRGTERRRACAYVCVRVCQGGGVSFTFSVSVSGKKRDKLVIW